MQSRIAMMSMPCHFFIMLHRLGLRLAVLLHTVSNSREPVFYDSLSKSSCASWATYTSYHQATIFMYLSALLLAPIMLRDSHSSIRAFQMFSCICHHPNVDSPWLPMHVIVYYYCCDSFMLVRIL